MPTGKVKWYDVEKGFGFLSQDEGEDVYVRSSALPEGVEALKPGQRVEFGMAAGRRGPQALSLKLLETPPTVSRGNERERGGERGERGGERRGRGGEGAPTTRKSTDELHGLIEDMITLLETKVQPDLRRGKYPDRKMSTLIAEVVRGVARELDH